MENFIFGASFEFPALSHHQVGLWHAVLASVFNGMHVVFVPYALMKVNPASWMQMVTKHR